MYSAAQQNQFAKSYADAMLGYMNASVAAQAAIMRQMMELWSSAARAAAGAQAEPAPSFFPMAAWGLPAVSAQPSTPWPFLPWLPRSPALNPAEAFLQPMDWMMSMSPFGRSPMVLQMAFGMMSFGIPREVAMPAAEANAAALDAAEAAAKPIQNAFSAYRSDGGHASAQIVHLRRIMATVMLSPLGAASLGPWLMAPRGAGLWG